MKKTAKTKPGKESAEHLVDKHNAQARVTHELARQLEPYLPIDSFEEITEKLDEVVVENRKLPLKTFAPSISSALFPIKTKKDLEQKLSDGVRRAISLARSDSIPVTNKFLSEIVAEILQETKREISLQFKVRSIFRPVHVTGSKAFKGDHS